MIQPGKKRADWFIRAYQSGDEHQIVKLFEVCFGKPITTSHWRWKLKEVNTQVENVWVAEAHGQIIGHYAGIPVRFWLNGHERFAMVIVDAMIHPDFSGKWVFMTMMKYAHKVWKESGIAFWLGLPNQQWGTARKKRIGIQDIFPLVWKVRPLHLETILASRLSIPLIHSFSLFSNLWNMLWDHCLSTDKTIRLTPVNQAGTEFDQFWRTVRTHIQVSVIRDRAWIHWRYLTAPEQNYRVLLAEQAGHPVGYVVYRLWEDTSGTKKVGLIAEIFADPCCPIISHTLLIKTIQLLKQEGTHSVLTLSIPGTRFATILNRAGFVFGRKGRFDVCIIPFDPALSDTLSHRQKWYMTGGDFDII